MDPVRGRGGETGGAVRALGSGRGPSPLPARLTHRRARPSQGSFVLQSGGGLTHRWGVGGRVVGGGAAGCEPGPTGLREAVRVSPPQSSVSCERETVLALGRRDWGCRRSQSAASLTPLSFLDSLPSTCWRFLKESSPGEFPRSRCHASANDVSRVRI